MAWYLQVAIEHALTVLSWYENLQEDERPPEYLWEDSEGLEQWWADVEAKRNPDHIGPTSRGRSDHDPTDQTPQVAENDYARFVKGR